MKKIKISSILVLCILLVSNILVAQTNKDIKKVSEFVILESKTNLSKIDKEKIESVNFNDYRFYTIRKKIQIVRGPLIELLSLKELEDKGLVYAIEYTNNIKSKPEVFKHETILLLDIGLGNHLANEPK